MYGYMCTNVNIYIYTYDFKLCHALFYWFILHCFVLHILCIHYGSMNA